MKKLLITFSLLSVSAFSQEFSSYTTCGAHTNCFNYYGQYIGTARCEVHGSSVADGGRTNNACHWNAIPNVGVSCSGYMQVQNQWGEIVWAWQDVVITCPR